MASVNLVVIVESIRALMSQATENGFYIQTIIAVAAALGMQSALPSRSFNEPVIQIRRQIRSFLVLLYPPIKV